MKFTENCAFIIVILLLVFQKSLAQRGYNYVRPGLGATTGSNNVGGVGNIPPTSPLNNLQRPIVAALPTGNGAATPSGYATAPTAFGAPSTAVTAQQQGTTAFGGFSVQPTRPLAPTVATNAYGGGIGGSTGVLSRQTATQRTAAGGPFGTNLGRAQTTQFTNVAGTTGATGTGADYDGGDGDYSAIPGVPGVDYPIYSQVPTTSFDCAQQPLPGYYSDVEAQCQVFHICALNRTYSFLCPNGTIFSQEVLVCIWWNQYDCASAPALYANNAFIYDYGSRVAPTDATSSGYQVSGIVGGASSRTQSNFPIASTNTARTSSSATTAQTVGIFGNSLGIRPMVTSGGFGGYTTPITPAPTAAVFGSRISNGRLPSPTATPPASQQTFLNAAAVLPGTPIGSFSATGPDGTTTGGVALRPNALQTAQLATSSTNREYLPPAQRP